MKVLLASIGTRGDMEPFLAVGELLVKRGHEVVCVFPEQFGELAKSSGFRFRSLGPEFMNLLESDIGKAAMGGSATLTKKLKAYAKMAKLFAPIRKTLVHRQKEIIEDERPDRIVHHPKAIYPFLWGLDEPGKSCLILPVPYVMHPVNEMAHVMFNRNLGTFLNRLSYRLARFGLFKALRGDTNSLELDKPFTKERAGRALDLSKAVYTISPSLFSRPEYWPDHVKVLGYHERDKTLQWEPSKGLLEFLSRHQKFLLVTFGSMINPAPREKTSLLVRLLEKNKIPAIINCAGGGLIFLEDFESDLIHFVKRIPYDFIFPKTYGVIHHGGSGTSHMAMKYGCASLIIPHIIDQFLWNNILSKKGVGPKGPSITALKAKTFELKLCSLWENRAYKEKAEELASKMSRENLEDELVTTIVKDD